MAIELWHSYEFVNLVSYFAFLRFHLVFLARFVVLFNARWQSCL